MIKLIVAHDENNMIGNKGKLPWEIKDEFTHFKNSTMGDALLMGRVSFEGLPSKLPGRKVIVLTTKGVEGADEIISSEEELLDLFKKYKTSSDVLWIAGGKAIYEQYYTYADELVITEVKGKHEGDCQINLNLDDWNKKKIKEHPQFTVYSYTKK